MHTDVPDLLGYNIEAMLSQHHHADVFRVSQVASAKSFALKLAKTEQGGEQLTKEIRLLREYAGIAGIVNIVDAGELGNQPYLLMPFYQHTLHEKLTSQGQAMSYAETLGLLKSLTTTLNTLHEQGVLHGDLHPRNIMQDKQGEWYIIDFAGALTLQQDAFFNAHKKRMGTLLYASPELREGIVQISVQSEVYAMTSLVCAMLSGQLHQQHFSQLQFTDSSLKLDVDEQQKLALLIEQAQHIWFLSEQIKPIPRLLRALKKGLAIHPNERFATLQSLYEAVEEAILPLLNVHSTHDAHSNGSDATLEFAHSSEFNEQIEHVKQALVDILIEHGKIESWHIAQVIGQHQVLQNLTSPQDALLSLAKEAESFLLQSPKHAAFLNWARNTDTYKKSYGKYITRENARNLLTIGRQQGAGTHNKLSAHINREFVLQSWLSANKLKALASASVFVLLALVWLPPTSFELLRRSSTGHPAENTSSAPIQTQARLLRPTISEALADSHAETNAANSSLQPSHSESHQSFNLSTATKFIDFEVVDAITKVQHQLRFSRVKQVNMQAGNAQSKEQANAYPQASSNSLFYVMTEEVSQGLWQACVNSGRCRQTKAFSTDSNRQQMLDHDRPVVNVNWYDVTEDFIPYINETLDAEFSLPTIAQWLSYAYSTDGVPNFASAIHCQDCPGSNSRFENATMPTNLIASGPLGLLHVYGNAQEWLQDCWQDVKLKTQRCDQAPVVGGAWFDTKQQIEQQPMSKLLKTARSMTTGFRLVKRETGE